MSKYNYDSERDDERFPPCKSCGGEEVTLNALTDLLSCATCGGTLREVVKHAKKEKAVGKKVRLNWK